MFRDFLSRVLREGNCASGGMEPLLERVLDWIKHEVDNLDRLLDEETINALVLERAKEMEPDEIFSKDFLDDFAKERMEKKGWGPLGEGETGEEG